jgi:hypothetical protein
VTRREIRRQIMAEESGLVALQSDPRPAISVFLAYGRGENKDIKKVAQAGAHLVLYGLYEFADKPEVLQAMKAMSGQPKMQDALSTPEEVALALATKFAETAKRQKALIIQLIQLLLKAKTA